MAGMSWQAIADRLTEEGATAGRETVRHWSLQPDWIAAANARRDEIEQATVEAQVGLVELAYGVIREVLTSEKASDEARLSAADKALKYLGPAVKSEVSLTGSRSLTDAEIEAEARRLLGVG